MLAPKFVRPKAPHPSFPRRPALSAVEGRQSRTREFDSVLSEPDPPPGYVWNSIMTKPGRADFEGKSLTCRRTMFREPDSLVVLESLKYLMVDLMANDSRAGKF
jgi:hypothetical protein